MNAVSGYKRSLKMNKKYFLLLYGVLTVGNAVALWGLNLWGAENIMYGLLIVPVQLGLMQLVFKHRESADSFVNHLVIVPSALFMLLIINTISASLFISFLISLIMLIPFPFLEKYMHFVYVNYIILNKRGFPEKVSDTKEV